mmetsp:Transcript_20837/g.65988  ORF Transcript_20837/g.65988 Transcript_20837/m.65988 type:complete len:207 (+) Transcript_20837:151-771(+)
MGTTMSPSKAPSSMALTRNSTGWSHASGAIAIDEGETSSCIVGGTSPPPPPPSEGGKSSGRSSAGTITTGAVGLDMRRANTDAAAPPSRAATESLESPRPSKVGESEMPAASEAGMARNTGGGSSSRNVSIVEMMEMPMSTIPAPCAMSSSATVTVTFLLAAAAASSPANTTEPLERATLEVSLASSSSSTTSPAAGGAEISKSRE